MRAAGGGPQFLDFPPSTEAPACLLSSQLRVLISARCPTVIGSLGATFRATPIKSQPAEPTHELSRLW